MKFKIDFFLNGHFHITEIQNKSFLEYVLGSIKKCHKRLYFEF